MEHPPAIREVIPVARRIKHLTRHAAPEKRPAILDYWELTKPEIAFLVMISALAGFLLGSPGSVDAWLLGCTLLGTGLSAAGGGALNHYMERSYDALMRRTATRPLPSGRMAPLRALSFGILLTGVGLAFLSFVNLLTVILAALTVALYILVYTPLKRKTKHNTLVGIVPGALPGLGGFAAATGTLGLGGWALFLILALWQMPHFLSLAWMYRKDYARARYAISTVFDPDGRSTARQTLLYTGALCLAAMLPTAIGLSGWIYLTGAAILGIWFLLPATAFYRSRTIRDARRVLVSSILYIPLLVVLIFVDRWVQ